ncbi:LOW QUALITY PROTEIN: hypothetical protein CRUP_013591, partial [Coryphaenoides rupestris]
PPRPDYTESEILRAYRAQKELDFEDPYQPSVKQIQNGGYAPCSATVSLPAFPTFGSVLPNGVEVVPSAPVAGNQDTDYSDPFDARPEPRTRTLQHNTMNSRPGASDGDQLYDNPSGSGRTTTTTTTTTATKHPPPDGQQPGPGSGLTQAEGRESKLPQDDERPADEYDQPWDSAGAGAGAGSGGSATLRLVGDTPPLLGERVDPATPLERQVWYHGALSRGEAEALLTLCKESSYLVRNSQGCATDYSLSLSVPEVIHHYTTHKLPIRGAEHMSLLYPVI